MIRAGWLIPYAVLLALVSVAISPLAAAEIQTSPDQASKFVQDLGGQAMTLLAEYPDGDTRTLQSELRDLIHRSFDLDLIGRFALGPAWETATPAQQQEYQELFAQWTADTYARRLGADRGGASLTVVGAQPGLDTPDAVVRTQINRPDGISIAMNLRVHDSGGQLKVVDVSMAGVSMAVTQRDEFASIIQRKGIDGLIGDLRAHVNDNLRVQAAQR